MEFEWSEDERELRRELVAFLGETLPDDWEAISKSGPGSDAQAEFSKEFCPKLAAKGWLTQHWPREYGGLDASPWRHAILGEEMWRCGEPRSGFNRESGPSWVSTPIVQSRRRSRNS